MSIVAVHGPQTFGSKAVVGGEGPAMATVDPTNGLKWDFKLDGPTTRVNGDFSWAFPPDGTPTPQALADPAVVTYAAAGNKTATLTVTGAGTGANPYPPAGVYTIPVTAVAGVAPLMAGAPPEEGEEVTTEEPTPENGDYTEEAYSQFILADHSVNDVKEFLSHYELTEDDWDALVSEESEGADRATLLDWLNAQRA